MRICDLCFKSVDPTDVHEYEGQEGHPSCINEFRVKRLQESGLSAPAVKSVVLAEPCNSCRYKITSADYNGARCGGCADHAAATGIYISYVWEFMVQAGGVKGVDPNAPLETLETGAKQSKSPYRFDLLDPAAMFKLTELLAKGAEKYGVDNWRAIPVDSHLNHMLVHAYAYLAGDTSDDHLTHMLARSLFAVAVKEQIERERVTE